MSAISLKCPECGGKLPGEQLGECEYCGARLAVTLKALPREAPTPGPETLTAAERIARVERSAEMARALQVEPSSAGEVVRHGWKALVGVVMALFGIGFIGSYLNRSAVIGLQPELPGFDLLFLLVPLVFVGIGIWTVISGLARVAQIRGAPLDRLASVVINKRTDVSSGGRRDSATTTYFSTLELKNGVRRELRTNESLAGLIKPGDVGVAFVKADLLLEFLRVDVGA